MAAKSILDAEFDVGMKMKCLLDDQLKEKTDWKLLSTSLTESFVLAVLMRQWTVGSGTLTSYGRSPDLIDKRSNACLFPRRYMSEGP